MSRDAPFRGFSGIGDAAEDKRAEKDRDET